MKLYYFTAFAKTISRMGRRTAIDGSPRMHACLCGILAYTLERLTTLLELYPYSALDVNKRVAADLLADLTFVCGARCASMPLYHKSSAWEHNRVLAPTHAGKRDRKCLYMYYTHLYAGPCEVNP